MDLAFIVGAGGLGPRASGRAAAEFVREVARMADTDGLDPLAGGLAAVTPHMWPGEATALLLPAMARTKERRGGRMSRRRTDDAGAGRRGAGRASRLADAPGRPLPARVPRHARPGGQLPRPLLHARARPRGHAPADPPLRLRRGHPLRRHPARPAGARRRRSPSSRARGPASRASRPPPTSPASEPLDAIDETLAPVYETVRLLRAALPPGVPLIGFAGAPWTVATYMVAGRGTPDQAPARALLYREPATFDALVDRITEATIAYLGAQIDAGAQIVKLFDSWAGSLPGPLFAALRHRSRPPHRRGAPRRAPRGAAHRLSPRRRRRLRRPTPRRPAPPPSPSTPASTPPGRRRGSSPAAASRATSTRCSSSPAATPSSPPPAA